MSVAQILARSSNVGAVTIARKLGPADLEKWIARFGFGKSTGIDFPGESVGIVPKWPEQWSGTTIGNVPIGQGIAVTSVQIAAAYAAIANDGVWVEPHLISRVGGAYIARPKRRRVVSVAVDRQLKTMLTNVVDEHGATGNEAKITGYSVAGKTGTAQIPGPHGYTTGKYVASFVGFVPVKKPKLLVLASVQEPHGSIYGGPSPRPRSPGSRSSTCSTSGSRPTSRSRPPRRLGRVRLTILHTNDIHGRGEAIARIATLVRREKASSGHRVLDLDAGDVEETTNRLSSLTKGTAMHRLLSLTTCDAAAVGNACWLRYGPAVLEEHACVSSYPQLLANFGGLRGPVPSVLLGDVGVFGLTAGLQHFVGSIDVGFEWLDIRETAVAKARGLRRREPSSSSACRTSGSPTRRSRGTTAGSLPSSAASSTS